MAMLARRKLALASVDAIRVETRHLLAVGYTRTGNWSLGQTCYHLALWIRYPLDGFPPLSLGARPLAWALRNTVAPWYTRRVLAGRRVPRGIPAPLGTVPPASVADADAVAEYEEQLNRLRGYTGVPHPSPLLGPLTGGELVALTCVHAAHHLSFLVPK